MARQARAKPKPKPKRKGFQSRGRGDTFAKRRGQQQVLDAELDNHATIKSKLADIERRQTEARDRQRYHELRMAYLGGEITQNRF